MFHVLFPSLLKRDPPFITAMQTPIVKVFLRGKNHCKIEENVIGIIPSIYPKNDVEINKVLNILQREYYFEKTISGIYIQFLRNVLINSSLINENISRSLFQPSLIRQYPIIDYFYFHCKYQMRHHSNPSTGYDFYYHLEFPGLDFSPPYTLNDIIKFQKILS
jgi:hypothetical protein